LVFTTDDFLQNPFDHKIVRKEELFSGRLVNVKDL
jgi:hypothetical protein